MDPPRMAARQPRNNGIEYWERWETRLFFRGWDLFKASHTTNIWKSLFFDPAELEWLALPLFGHGLLIQYCVFFKRNYTGSDWKLYMQEVEGFVNGTTNYAQLGSDTGPLVYPAFFVYVYSIFYFVTSFGENPRLAQYIFAAIYLLQLWLVLRLFIKSRKIPPYFLALGIAKSTRIHMIYSARLFNDPIAVLFTYAAINLFLDRRWTFGSVMFSLGVGIKMNILLFAPAVLMLYITSLGYVKTVKQLAVCAGVQLIIGAPFLLTHPIEYIKGVFDLGRTFDYQWNVNYQFLGIEVFRDKIFHTSLLVFHVALLALVAKPCWTFFKNYARLRSLQAQFEALEPEEEMTEEQRELLRSFEAGLKNQVVKPSPVSETSKKEQVEIYFDQCCQLALLPIFLINFIGVVCARSLHYQFYVWYFHSLPYLSWFTDYHVIVKILIINFIEKYQHRNPSTDFSSAMLHICHIVLLVGVVKKLYSETRPAREDAVTTKKNNYLEYAYASYVVLSSGFFWISRLADELIQVYQKRS